MDKRQNKKVYFFLKRIIDIMIGLVGLVFLGVTYIIFYIIFKIEKNNGNLFFLQERIGHNGKKFKIIKFRSMVENAEEILKKDKDLYKKYVENSYKLLPEEDPRMTKFGKFIRKTSLDEIPQFINILKGDMSFVGPRPVIEEELQEYGDNADEFLSIKPGATGWWQVSGRSDIAYPERCDLELYYVRNCSLKLDFKIILLEFKRMVFGKGAY